MNFFGNSKCDQTTCCCNSSWESVRSIMSCASWNTVFPRLVPKSDVLLLSLCPHNLSKQSNINPMINTRTQRSPRKFSKRLPSICKTINDFNCAFAQKHGDLKRNLLSLALLLAQNASNDYHHFVPIYLRWVLLAWSILRPSWLPTTCLTAKHSQHGSERSTPLVFVSEAIVGVHLLQSP